MAVWRTVLTATDFSDIGNRAIPQAYALLRGVGGVVHLCHVVEQGLIPDVSTPLSDQQRRDLETRLRELIPKEAQSYGIQTKVHVLAGEAAAPCLARAAECLGADVVAMGTHGRTGVQHLVLGSVAEAVTRLSTRPMLLIRAPRV